MRKRVVAVVGIACALGLAGGALVANAGTDITAPETFTVLGTTIKDRFVDVGKKGFGPGDVSVFVDNLTDDSGALVGKSRIQCTIHIGPWAICTGTFNVNGRGEIVGQGLVPFSEDATTFDVPITGGTGEFDNVRGEVHIELVADGQEENTFDLIP